MKKKLSLFLAVILVVVLASILLIGCKSVDDRVKDTTDELNKYLYSVII